MGRYYLNIFPRTASYHGKPVRVLGTSDLDVLIQIEDCLYATVSLTDLTFSETEVINRNSVETR